MAILQPYLYRLYRKSEDDLGSIYYTPIGEILNYRYGLKMWSILSLYLLLNAMNIAGETTPPKVINNTFDPEI